MFGDQGHLPDAHGVADIQIFSCISTVNDLQWHTWNKPRGKSMLHVLCIGGGAGGGRGHSAAAGNPRGGGGGGGGGIATRALFPLHLLPDVLYLQVGAGGAGDTGSGAGNGLISFIAISPRAAGANFYFLNSSNNNPGGGGAGTAGAAGGAGSAPAAMTSSSPFSGISLFLSSGANLGGSAGGVQTGAIGQGQAVPSNVTTGGAGGAGTQSADFAGGLIARGVVQTWLQEQIPLPAAAGSNPGPDGLTYWKPFFSFGGFGGSSSNTGVGGKGGNGGIGSGGGGGGGGTTGGFGGNGGPGLIIMTAW